MSSTSGLQVCLSGTCPRAACMTAPPVLPPPPPFCPSTPGIFPTHCRLWPCICIIIICVLTVLACGLVIALLYRRMKRKKQQQVGDQDCELEESRLRTKSGSTCSTRNLVPGGETAANGSGTGPTA